VSSRETYLGPPKLLKGAGKENMPKGLRALLIMSNFITT